jgi:hypothetical protein
MARMADAAFTLHDVGAMLSIPPGIMEYVRSRGRELEPPL